MKTLIVIHIVLVFTFFCSCLGKGESIKHIEKKSFNKDLVFKDTIQNKILKDRSFIDLIKVKEEFGDGWTSSFIEDNSIRLYAKLNEGEFYGYYILSKYYEQDNDVYIAGKITISNDENPWFYNTPNDTFIELIAYKPGIIIFSDIQIGADASKLTNYLGCTYFKKDNLLVYVDKKVNLIALFLLKKNTNTIKWFRIGYYNDVVVNNINEYLELLLKASNNNKS